MFSLKAKIGLGIIFSYTSFEVYMALKSQYLINQRKTEYQRLQAAGSLDKIDLSKFRSATIAGMFVNPFDEYRAQTAFEFLLVRIMEAVESIYGSEYELHHKLPNDFRDVETVLKPHQPDIELLRKNSKILAQCKQAYDNKLFESIRNQLGFTWLGQSCCLVQLSGINILTDPIFSDHLLSPYFGPKRLVASPMDIAKVKRATNNNLDVILVSHDHPDHLELNSAKEIGNKSLWIVPIGLKKKLARKGIFNVIEMDWWESISLNKYINAENLPDKYEITCVPAMHWSGRYIFDCNQSLWCSFVIRRNNECLIYHAGDTGYSKDLFITIGKVLGPMKLSLLPIGQYCPSWHQKPRHTSPAEAIKIARHLNSESVMGIHWGTFKISSEPILEPKYLFEKLALKTKTQDFYKAPELGLSYWYDLNNSKPPQAKFIQE